MQRLKNSHRTVDTWGGGSQQPVAPIGWSTDQYSAYAPDGTKFDLYDPALWDYDGKLKADAAAQKAADDAAAQKAADDAAAAQKAADDAAAAAAQKAADEAAAAAAAQKAADAAAADAADEPDHSDVGVYTYHHEDQFNFHHDSTVPHHIPTTKISADIAAMHPHIPTHGVKVV